MPLLQLIAYLLYLFPHFLIICLVSLNIFDLINYQIYYVFLFVKVRASG